ncbi:hypothetical protein OKJ48_07205 [Streptomyces kunmingensis]|uniref:Uncharacterized protein n=1 Tax=Streptomyces kunmingensis TaxID=68225 RepID=A0ABU6C5S8_9ACTN|nr:hypothetical protein [Streptomyces kunmingensis]MEB3960039.1 hypothetical protein [Streptomyces kunmingensis]
MIRTARHPEARTGPADLGLALTVVSALHPPVTRAPEVVPAATRRAVRGRRAAVRG